MAGVLALTTVGLLMGAKGCGPAPAAPTVEMAAFHFEAKSTTGHVVVEVDAYDQFGMHGISSDGNKPYPFSAFRAASDKVPYVHRIYFEPGLIISATFRVYLSVKNANEVISCDVFDSSGQKIPLGTHVVSGDKQAVCLYTGGVPGVPPFEKPPGK
jgi:hypothetical protein